MRRPVRHLVASAVVAAAGLAAVSGAPTASAQTPAPPEPPVSDSLIQVPEGCPTPEPAVLVFTGTMVGKDDVTEVVRFRIDQLRAGSTQPWAIDGLIDISYGDDYRFLDEGGQYLVGAGFDEAFGTLVSSVRPSEPLFGGNDVVGIDDLAVECPELDDPVRTLNADGTSVDTGVLSLLFEDRRLLAATVFVPAVIVFVTLIALVVLKVFGSLAFQGVFRLGRAAVTPVPDHRKVRTRTHRGVMSTAGGTDVVRSPSGRVVGDPTAPPDDGRDHPGVS